MGDTSTSNGSVEPMRYNDALRAAEISLRLNTTGDPLQHYLVDTLDNQPHSTVSDSARRTHYSLAWSKAVFQQCAWKSCDGDVCAYLMLFNGVLPERKTRTDGFLDSLYPFVSYALDRLGTTQQKRRREEFGNALYQAFQDTFGDRFPQIIGIAAVVVSLPTTPVRLRPATPLVRFVTKLADTQNRAVSVLSSTQGDTEFFGALGFGKVATLTVGANDPERTGEPVHIDVMLREPTQF